MNLAETGVFTSGAKVLVKDKSLDFVKAYTKWITFLRKNFEQKNIKRK